MRGWLAGHSTSLIVCLHPESGTVAAPVPLVISVALRAGVASLHAVVAPRPLTRHPRHTLGIAGAVRCGGAVRRGGAARHRRVACSCAWCARSSRRSRTWRSGCRRTRPPACARACAPRPPTSRTSTRTTCRPRRAPRPPYSEPHATRTRTLYLTPRPPRDTRDDP